MSVLNMWKAQRDDFRTFAQVNAKDAQAVGKRLSDILEEIRLTVMESQENVQKRQCVGIVFAQARKNLCWLTDLSKMTTVNVIQEPMTARQYGDDSWKSPEKAFQKIIAFVRNPLIMLVALGVIAAMSLAEKAFVPAGIAVILFAAVYAGGNVLKRDDAAKESVLADVQPQAALALHTDALMVQSDALMASLEQAVEDLGILDVQAKQNEATPKWQLEFYQRIWEAAINGEADDGLKLCRDALMNLGLKAIELDGHNHQMFQWMRSSKDTAMIYPALCDYQTGALVLPGRAISPDA